MTPSDLASRRFRNQQLAIAPFKSPEEVVCWLGAVQAQDYAGAKWGLAQRTADATNAEIDRVFDAGGILRTHVMRPTWHFVSPADIRWLLELTAPRVHAANAYIYRQFEVNEAIFRRSRKILVKALRGGQQLTRDEIAKVYQAAGIAAKGVRLASLVMDAELEGVICSGARRGKHFTYALLDERVPVSKPLERDEALGELTRRYFRSRGPALVRDFAWWSGLTVTDAKRGTEVAKRALGCETIDGKTYWFSEEGPTRRKQAPIAHLLPNYDEYFIGYAERAAFFAPKVGQKMKNNPTTVYAHIVTMDGRVIGGWRRAFAKGAAILTLDLLRPIQAEEKAALKTAAERFGEFIGLPVKLSYRTSRTRQ